MSIKHLLFMTPSNILHNKIVLEKSYSQYLTLKDGSTLTVASNIGHKETQQDCTLIAQKEDIILLLVADGMGGLQEGEKASYYTVKKIYEWFQIEGQHKLINMTENYLRDSIYETIYRILDVIPYESGTTLNMSIISPKKTLIINIGDSRTYTIKDGKISLVTKDDSQAFKIFNPQTREERDKIRFYNQNYLLTNAISRKRFPIVTVTTIQNKDYDIICHTTDGISDILSESEIEELSQSPNPALSLVNSSVFIPRIQGEYHLKDNRYQEYINPGKDNATAIVYTKKRTKNN